MRLLADLMLLLGAIFLLLGSLGLLRMPDVYTRIQAGAKAATLGTLAILLGVALLQPGWSAKLVLLALLVMISNPVGSSALARMLQRRGVPIWRKSKAEKSS